MAEALGQVFFFPRFLRGLDISISEMLNYPGMLGTDGIGALCFIKSL